MNKIYYITKKGLKKIIKKIKNLKKQIKKNSKIIYESLEKGDLSENYEYKSAKENQIILQNKFLILNNKLNYIQIIKKKKNNNKITILSKIKIINLYNNYKYKYKLVSNLDTNYKNKISINSPLAKKLLGKKKNDIIKLKINNKKNKFKILKIY